MDSRIFRWTTAFLICHALLFSLALGQDEATNEVEQETELLVLTVASSETDGFKRFVRSSKVYNLNGKVLGMGEEWKGGDIKNSPGGGYKINLLKDELVKHKNNKNLVILFTDSYDVLLLADQDEILKKFKTFEANVVFGAEDFCWPDAGLKDQYPKVDRGYRFLNSGGFIGYASNLYEMVTAESIGDLDDDQLYYTKIYLNPELREVHKIKLDHTAEIFQNLNGAVSDVELKFLETEPYLANTIYDTKPLIVHGNGPSKRILNYLGNYLAKAWNTKDQCTSCWEDNIVIDNLKEVPHLVIAIFIEKATPFLEEFFHQMASLDYPRDKIDLFIHNGVEYHNEDVEDFMVFLKDKTQHKYHSIKLIGPDVGLTEAAARDRGIEFCLETKCDYYLSLDAEARLDNRETVKLLINQNRNVVAPMIVRPYKAWSNFWGALNSEEFYARGADYMDIVQNRRQGLWNVPYISSVYMIKGPFIHDERSRPKFVYGSLDPDMAFCKNMRENGDFFYVSNRVEWGHLVSNDEFSTAHLNNELWEIETNRLDWERRYLHPNYSTSLAEDAKIRQPCPDVYWFPIVSERFADELVAEMEHYGRWSDGSNQDNRLEGGYENVPTRDIHMKQISFDTHWLHFLNTYVRPLQEKVFTGYFSDPPRSLMNFVVRYRPDEQPFLRPHHDSSTYTINIALNRAGVDYEGGGCRFVRYNCSVTDTQKGWMLMHPGRLTHFHEGLYVTKGTRYIMISFVDP